ncbi:MBL fold metallo-hydrolase [Alloacidobacterium dinghuense]|uniref:MBL fold metallo-hydrolase n=1 Tax=Alloacidobacterium dinghuense TaxID=2763107 RepID=A0A7G8BN70_9BACT|nr:MBL fold metallo-hydrolase [Alloacidobacterium dinghuense]QNI33990.1 MBL fold metallo-hydrolase [Alloacidobacterium dinghuense]
MKIKLLGSSVPDPARRQYVSSYLVNGTVAIDVGCLGFYGTPQEQEAIRHVFLTHSHTDHTASLPIFVENAWTPAGNCARIYGSVATLDGVQKHIFNDVMWPDFIALSRNMPPFLRAFPIEAEVPVEADGLQVVPVPVHHVVPTFGYVVGDGKSAVIFGGDSGPTERLWEVAHQTPGLRAVFLEACFPNHLTGLAEASLHLTVDMFGREVAKMPSGIKVVAVHIKVRYREQVIRELQALQLPNLEIGECEREYNF